MNGSPGQARAALQSSAGAKTSARATADPQSHLHAGQVFFDPAPAAGPGQPQAIIDFRLDVEFDYTLLHVINDNGIDDIRAVSPYVLDSYQFRTDTTPTSQFPQGSTFIAVTGHFPGPGTPPPGAVDLFTIGFQLNSGVPDDTPLAVDLGSLGDSADYIGFEDVSDPANPGPRMVDDASHIEASEADFTVAQVTPEPASLGLLGFAAVLRGARRRAAGRSTRIA